MGDGSPLTCGSLHTSGARRLIRDSRRLTGINLLFDGPGAVLDVTFTDPEAAALLAAWERTARLMLNRIGWRRQAMRLRRVPGGALLFISAPMDALHSATEVNEWAWAEAEREVAGQATADIDAAAEALAAHISQEVARPLPPPRRAKEPMPVLVAGHRGKQDVTGILAAIVRGRKKQPRIVEVPREIIQRRGLPVVDAAAAIVTNTHDEQSGEWSPLELHEIAEAMLVVGHVAHRLVLNADDPILVETAMQEQRKDRIHAAIGYFSLNPAHPVIVRHLKQGGTAAFWGAKGNLVFARGPRRTVLCAAKDVPATMGGVARFGIANALGAILLASAGGVPKRAIVEGLKRYRPR